ncbi:MAG: formate dehydrogenase accessory sulfurtransferase FdhD [Alphaproteobacteria bacterium]|nr:formate dehydrogenase accessory sulfurtransferase FdhD [Alphaproteobacteria bacterium]
MNLSPVTLPQLTRAEAPLTLAIEALDEHGHACDLSIPAERALTVYVDKQELITLMTLGAHPEWLVLGYLRNQRLVERVDQIESITVDWDAGDAGAGVAAVKTRGLNTDWAERTQSRIVTTGCGQGSLFGCAMEDLSQVRLPDTHLSQARLYEVLAQVRRQESTYKSAGSVHGCALFDGTELLLFVEDVGRHNAIDSIAGWLWMQTAGAQPKDPLFYTTGRLTSEMVLKAAQMGVPLVVSRSGITQMGFELAQSLGVCAVGRALNRHFFCYTARHRFISQAHLALASSPGAA